MNRKWGILIAMAMMMITTLACGGEDNVEPIPEPTPSPAQQKHAMMANAYELGETIFAYDAPQTRQHALFYGGERIIYVKPNSTRTVKLTSNECLNLEFRSRNDNGDWESEYTFQPLSPGDYVLFDGSSWRVTTYTP